MSEPVKRYLTSEDRDRIIRKVIENPSLSKKEINQEAGITSRGSRREEQILKPWIRENTSLVFDEDIQWQSVELRSRHGTLIKPDFVGRDANGRTVIVEVKFKFDFSDDVYHLRSDTEHKSIGQILQYACAYRRRLWSKDPRLFIVSIDFSPDVSAVCEYLKEFNIDIQHIAIENILSQEEVSA